MAPTTKYSADALCGCVLPPKTSPDAFLSALADFASLVGEQFVEIVKSDELNDQSYLDPPKTHDSFHILDQDEYVASAVVCPANTEDVSKLLKLANKHKIPLWPVSIGRNFGYGGAAPRVRGSIVVDLGRRMNNVIEINEKSAYALVEPGVTFQALFDELQKRGSRLWIDVPDLGGGSVLGNALERGGGYVLGLPRRS
jgi:FAD/FMN-containing dehydrogenase